MASLRLREQDLAGKLAVVTGASRGIGRAIAMNLATRGCTILGTCSSLDTLKAFGSLQEELDAIYKDAKHTQSAKIVGICANIFSPTCAQTIADSVVPLCSGRVDIFVNNAADPLPCALGELTVEGIQQNLLGNIQTPVLIVEELVKRKFFQPESRIIYISSIRSRQPRSFQLMYSATKSAGESLCRTWAEAFGGKDERFAFMAGTTANAVTVGLTQTDSVMKLPEGLIAEIKSEFLPQQCLPRLGQPEDIADVVGLLCGRDARWITGSVISASGGGIKLG